jgi:hypothetical protein
MAIRSASAAGRERDAVRIVWSTRKIRDFSNGITFNRHPATNGTREFLKALAAARSSADNLANAPALTQMRSLTAEPEAPSQAGTDKDSSTTAPVQGSTSAPRPTPVPKACYENGRKVPCQQ